MNISLPDNYKEVRKDIESLRTETFNLHHMGKFNCFNESDLDMPGHFSCHTGKVSRTKAMKNNELKPLQMLKARIRGDSTQVLKEIMAIEITNNVKLKICLRPPQVYYLTTN